MAAGAEATASLIDAWVSSRFLTAFGIVKSQPSALVALVGLGGAAVDELLLQPSANARTPHSARTVFTVERLHAFR